MLTYLLMGKSVLRFYPPQNSAFIEISGVDAQSSLPLRQTLPCSLSQNASQTTMAPQKKVTSQTVASTTASKCKKIINGDTGRIDIHPSDLDGVLEQVNKEPSSPTTTLERAAHEHGSRLLAEG